MRKFIKSSTSSSLVSDIFYKFLFGGYATTRKCKAFSSMALNNSNYFLKSWRCKVISDLMINEQIRDREVRVIGEDGEQLGIMSAKEAIKLAEEAGVDLVKIAPTAKPPVCKIVDYGKFKYEQTRKEKEAKKKQKVIDVKEIRLSPNIDTNDLNTKINAARKFLSKGDKVKVTLRFRGREMAHMQSSKHILVDFGESLNDVAVVEKEPRVEGRSMTMFLAEKR
jgi:translation initiation factor IF-3